MRWILKETVYKRFANVLSTAVVVLVCAERANSFAQSQQVPPIVEGEERINLSSPGTGMDTPAGEGPTESRIPLSEQFLSKFDKIKTKAEACELLEGKIVTYYDVASLVRGCKQQTIEDAELLNELVHLKRKLVVEVPARIYRLIPFGRPLSKHDLDGGGGTSKTLSKQECEEVEGRYVTVSGMTYFYIEDCKRRAFESYYDLQEHNKGKTTIMTLTPETLYRITTGPGMKVKSANQEAILMKMDGDVKWSRLARANRGVESGNDSPESLQEIQKVRKVDRAEVCRKFNGKVVSFYSQMYFLEDCKRRPMAEFSLRLQQSAHARGGVIDISPEEFKAIPAGKAISEEDVLKLLR
jgi:hypothetical protein